MDPMSVFSKQSQQLASIQDGQVLVEVLYISVDPSNLGWISQDSFDMPAVEIGETMRAMGIAQVIESKNKHFQAGEIVSGLVGWQEYDILDLNDKKSMMKLHKLTDDLPLDKLICMPLALKAYYGIVDKAKIRSSDYVLIIRAAGTSGSVAGQVAKILGAKTVVGLVDSPQQKQWLTSACRFDAAIDVSNEDLDERLQELFPKGISVVFDDTGGEQYMHVIMTRLAHAARVVLCGTMSPQNQQKQHGLDTMSLIAKSATIYCFMLRDYKGQFTQAALTLSLWTKCNRLVLKVDQTEGFDCIPNTLMKTVSDPTITGKPVTKTFRSSTTYPHRLVVQSIDQMLGSRYFRDHVGQNCQFHREENRKQGDRRSLT